MKKTIIILLFSAIAFTSLQIACSKSEAQTTPATTSTNQIGKVIFTRNDAIWICNYDGTGLTQVNINLPQGIRFGFSNDDVVPAISPNGQKIFFTAGPRDPNSNFYHFDLYSCNIDGTGVVKIVDRAGGEISLSQAY